MDSTSIGTATLTRKVGDEEIRFRKINCYERARLLRELRQRDRQELIDGLRAAAATKEEILGELDQFPHQYGESHWTQYVNTPEGKSAVLLSALTAEYGEKAMEVLARFAPDYDTELGLIAELVNKPVRAAEPEIPLAYGQGEDTLAGAGGGAEPHPTKTPAAYLSYETPATPTA
jgi:hypothetical protein